MSDGTHDGKSGSRIGQERVSVYQEPDPLPDDCAWSTATWDEP